MDLRLLAVEASVLLVSAIMSAFGKGGGEFYVPIMLTAGLPYQQAAATSLLLLLASGSTMTVVYHRLSVVDWLTESLVVASASLGAFLGGMASVDIPPMALKLTFSAFLVASAALIGRRFRVRRLPGLSLRRRCCGSEYEVNLGLALPAVFLVGAVAGAVGVSGGGLVVPILIILGGMPLRVALASNSLLVLFSSASGFLGHALRIRVDWGPAAALAATVVVGAAAGARLSTRIETESMRRYFSIILLAAAAWMVVNALT